MTPPEKGDGVAEREVMIDVRHLTRYYGPVPALHDVSFQARRGEILGFLGPNGAGKTTAMRILTGYLPPSSGQAIVAGHDVVEDSLAARRSIGYLPENTPLYGDMTVYGYLDFMARLRGVRNRAEQIEEVMARVSIDHRADDLIGQLSKGLRQRVGIAQALVHKPPVIVLDEPTIGLDPLQVTEVRSLIRELGGDHTILLSTHVLGEVEKVCDRIMIINWGELLAVDALERTHEARHGGEEFRIAVKAPLGDAQIAKALEAVGGVTQVTALQEGRFLLTARRGGGSRERAAQAIFERGWQLSELTPIEVTLEDYYLRMTAAPTSEGEEGESGGAPLGDAKSGKADAEGDGDE